MVPITGRGSSFLVLLEFSKTKQRGGGTEQQQQIYQFTQGYNILHRLQVHQTLIFIIHKYLYTYRHMNCYSQLY